MESGIPNTKIDNKHDKPHKKHKKHREGSDKLDLDALSESELKD